MSPTTGIGHVAIPTAVRVELTVLTDPALAGIHEPRPLAAAER